MDAGPVLSAAAARARRLRFVLLLAAIVCAATAAIVLLSRHADRAQDGRVLAAGVDAELHRLEGLEWRLAASESLDAEGAAALAATRAAVRDELDGLRAIAGTRAVELRALFEVYDAALDEETRLRAAGLQLAADAVDRERVDPAYERLDGELEALVASLSDSAATTRAWTYAAIGLVLVAAVLGLLLLQRRRVAELARARGLQEGLERSTARLRALVEHGNDVIVLCGPDRRIRYSSIDLAPPGVRRRVGRRAPCALAFVAADDRPLARAAWGGIHAEPGSGTRLELRSRDGRWLEVVATNLIDDPDVGSIVLNVRDVTERHEAEARLREQEEQLQQARRLESIGRLAGGVAHDFNNLLSVIIGNAELAHEELEGSPLRDDLADVLSAAHRAAGLTRQLLAFSRRQFLQPVDLDLNRAVHDLHRMLARLIGEEYRLELRLSPQPQWVHADPGQVEQVLLNLCVNARDAMPDGGLLLIETDAVELVEGELRDAPPGRYVRLRVSDTGVGMDEETLARAFEPFFTTKPLGEGTGLGLSTVLGIVAQSDGHVAATSERGAGTTVSILLPALPCDDRAGTPPVADALA